MSKRDPSSRAPALRQQGRRAHIPRHWRPANMSDVNLKAAMTESHRAEFERGADMLKRAQAGGQFDDFWVPIGRGLEAARSTVLTVLKLNKPGGGYYNAAFGQLLANSPYAEMHNVERSNLLFCMDHLADIFEMRAAWTPSERAKINH